jgi:hypothetical protein
MLPSPQLRAAMHIATQFLVPDSTIDESDDHFSVTNPHAVGSQPPFIRIPYRSLYQALDAGYAQFVQQLKKHFKSVGWL